MLNLREHGWPWFRRSVVVALVGFARAIFLGFLRNNSFRRFMFAYLVAYYFFLTLALGGLYFVLIQHLTKAGWSVNLRRIAEWFASSMPVMAALSAPIVVSILLGKGDLYPWANSEYRTTLPHFKSEYLNPAMVIIRLIFYFAVWSGLGLWFWKQSIKQDQTGDIEITKRMQFWAAPP